MNDKNCLIIHGCPSDKKKAMDPAARTYNRHWLPWTKRELEKHGIPTEIPLMPELWSPGYERLRQKFEEYDVNKNTILIGTNCG